MALIGNITLLNRLPIKQTGGILAAERSMFNQSGTLGNIHLNQNSRLDQVSFPMGYYRGTWLLPQKAGALNAKYTMSGIGNFSANGFTGKSATLTLEGLGLFNATAGLLSGMTMTISGVGDFVANGNLALEAFLNMFGQGNFSAVLQGGGSMTIDLSGVGTMTLNPSGLGEMTLDINVNQSEATVQQIVDAVWNAFAVQYNISGTMGEKLNAAGTAGDPWTTNLAPYNTPGTAGKIVKQIKSITAASL